MVAVAMLVAILLMSWGIGFFLLRTLWVCNEALQHQRDAYREALTRAQLDLAAAHGGALESSALPSNEEMWALGCP